MAKTKKDSSNNISEIETVVLPADNKTLESFIIKHKFNLTESAVSSIEFAVKNNLPFVEIFKFNNSDFVITVAKEEFLENINHIYDLYLKNEKYELCPRVVKLQNILNRKLNEKEIDTTRVIN